jgi:hypothetical protein
MAKVRPAMAVAGQSGSGLVQSMRPRATFSAKRWDKEKHDDIGIDLIHESLSYL